MININPNVKAPPSIRKFIIFEQNKPMRIYLFIALMSFSFTNAQINKNLDLVNQPSFILKFGPRIFSPRFSFEKIKSDKSSIGLDFRGYGLWIPQGVRTEFFYRYYVDKAPWGFFIQPKVAVGYFSYKRYDNDTKGIQVGGGFNVGGQFNIGRKNAVVDVFAGLQWIAPIYIAGPASNRSFSNRFDYNTIHYILMAFPLDLGLRFGFVSNKKVPSNTLYQEEEGYF